MLGIKVITGDNVKLSFNINHGKVIKWEVKDLWMK